MIAIMLRVALLGVVLFSAACTVTPSRTLPDNAEQAWQLRKQALRQIPEWRMQGSLAIHTSEEAWRMSIDWRQQAEAYRLRIVAPMGQGSVHVAGSPEQATIDSSDGEHVVTDDPEGMLSRQLGWYVPVTALRHWMLGLPAPGPRQKTLDEYGRLAELEQAGWHIEFLDYESGDKQGEGAPELPTRLFLRHADIDVHLSVSRWGFDADARGPTIQW